MGIEGGVKMLFLFKNNEDYWELKFRFLEEKKKKIGYLV